MAKGWTDAEFEVVRGPRLAFLPAPKAPSLRTAAAVILGTTLALQPLIYFGAHVVDHLRTYWLG